MFENPRKMAFADEVLNFVSGEFKPEDVFDEEILKEWALENGFVEAHD